MSGWSDRGAVGVALAACLLGLLLTVIRALPPGPADPSGDGSFSAVRARQVLEELYTDAGIHPIGSPNNRRLKEKILGHLRDLGYEPSVQRSMACWEAGGCGEVENILARLEGKGSGRAVLLVAHYDGVGAGPSVADNGLAVAATLEIARLLKVGPTLDNDIIFLIDDGEEAYLLGAAAFAAKHPWADEVGAVVNLEARGSGGRSHMFETGVDNAWLIDLMKQEIPRPSTSSLYYAIYQRLPNDTDFTVFRHNGMSGVNFAIIQDVVHYHTPRDDLAHASSASLQHHGDNALGMVRALAGADLDSTPEGTASWFDVWGFGILSWPETWNLRLAVFALLSVFAAAVLSIHRGDLTVRQLALGLLVYLMSLIGATLLAVGVAWLLRSIGHLPAWPAHTWAPQAAFWLLAIGFCGWMVTSVGRRCGSFGFWLGVLTGCGLLAVLVATLLPGATYLFLAPALVGGVLTTLAVFLRARLAQLAALGLTVLAACATQLVIAWSLWDAMGIPIMPAVVFLVAATATLALAPAAGSARDSSQRAPTALLALAAILAITSLLLPAYSPESPRPLNIYFVQNGDTGQARFATAHRSRPLPKPLDEAIDWRSALDNLYPWDHSAPAFLVADVEAITAQPPRLEILASEAFPEHRRVKARLSTLRSADRGALVMAEAERLESLLVDGWEFDLESTTRAWHPDGRRVVRFPALPPGGIELELVVRGQQPFIVYVLDTTYGLPKAGEDLLEARPEDVVPISRGDLTIMHVRAEI